ncbi:MAG: hypothetical protein CMJ34_09795 [Phycisphaerae bacterium]|nr:hypothetical protein [Phycisphaerae bacterium]
MTGITVPSTSPGAIVSSWMAPPASRWMGASSAVERRCSRSPRPDAANFPNRGYSRRHSDFSAYGLMTGGHPQPFRLISRSVGWSDRQEGFRMSDGESAERRSAIVLDLFDRYYDRVFAFARRSVGPNLAEDATQEAFLRLLQHPRLEELEISISYMLRVVQNILRRRHTRTARLREILEQEIKPRQRRKEADGTNGIYQRPEPRTVLENMDLELALNRLSNDERDTIRLVVCEGLSYAEAARSLGVSVTTVNNWRHRGLARLRGLVHAEGVLHQKRNRTCRGQTG